MPFALQDVIDRIDTGVAALSGRVRGAAEYQHQLRAKTLLQGAFVMPAGIRGGKVRDVTGGYVQDIDDIIAVVIIVPDPSPAGGRQVAVIDALIRSTIGVLCGWQPDGAMGRFALMRAAMINLGNGALAYQIDFTISDQLRIPT